MDVIGSSHDVWRRRNPIPPPSPDRFWLLEKTAILLVRINFLLREYPDSLPDQAMSCGRPPEYELEKSLV
jgi:hypothetical protein